LYCIYIVELLCMYDSFSEVRCGRGGGGGSCEVGVGEEQVRKGPTL